MLRFVAPQALWLLLLLPLLILLHMLRARRVTTPVSSTLLWERATRDLVTRLPVRRLERSLLLLLQLFAVTALALALARPAVQMQGTSGAALVLVFDTSMSMQARDVGRPPVTRLEAAQADAEALLARAGRGLPVMVVDAGATPRIALELSTEPAAIRRAIRRLSAGDGPADLDSAVQVAAAQRVRGRPAQVVVFSDIPGPALPRVSYRTFGRPSNNLAVTRATVSTSGGGRTLLLTEVRNYGTATQRATLRVTWPTGVVERAVLAVPPDAPVTRVWTARGDGPARVDLEASDVLPADNHAVVTVGGAARPRVLLVTRGNPFLEAVLSVLPASAEMTAALNPAEWAGYDLVILDRVRVSALPAGQYLLVGTVPDTLPLDVGDPVQNVTVLRSEGAHPLLRMVDLSGVRVEEALALRPRGGTVLAEGTVPLLWAVERAGLRVVLLPFDLQRSDLPVHPAFPVLMANALQWLAPPATVEAGSSLQLAAPAERGELVDAATGRSVAVVSRNGALALPPLERSGLYTLKVGGVRRPIIVTAATGTESDLRHAGTTVGQPPSGTGLREQELWWVLLVLGLLFVLIEGVLWLRSQPFRTARASARARRPVPGLRLAVVGLLILALTGLEVARGGRDLAVVFALDLSDSVSAADRQRAVDLMQAAVAQRRPGDRFGMVTFGAQAIVAEGMSEAPRLTPATRPAAQRTDIGAAIRTALGLLPPGGARRIVLLTDGGDTEGGAAAAAGLAAAGDVELGLVPLGTTPGAEARVDVVQVPAAVRVGERFEVQTWVESTGPASGTLRLRLNGREVWRGPVRLPEGRTLLRVPQQAAAPGNLTYEVRLEVNPDAVAANNQGFGVVQVRGSPTVLYVSREPGPLPEWLRAQRLAVRAVTPEALPADPAQLAGIPAVILDDLPATVLSPAQMRALKDYVGALGGGLVVVGGPHAFGVGGYAGTDLEAALPVSMDVRHRVAIPSVAVMLVIDASGSMGSFGPEVAKVELAKEAAQSVIDLLAERDLIGVIAFDQQPHWLVRPTEARRREQILAQVSRISAGGGTNLYPALQDAYRALQRVEAKVRHVIVLSDGQTDPGDFERLVTRMARDRITVSSVAIGGDADQEIMRDVAGWGHGRFYYTKDLYTIPQIVTAEAVLATRAYLIEEPFRPLASPVSPILRGLRLPPLRGYVATAAKPAATLHAVSPQQDPLLASWQYGLGRALVFTSDARARWAAGWMTWPEASLFWSRAVRWTMADPATPLDVQTEVRGDRVRVVLEARGADGTLLTDLTARAQVVGRPGPVGLVQSAPGRYEGDVVVTEPGGYLVTVEAHRNGRLAGTGRATVVVPAAPELAGVGAGLGTLNRLVEVAGARVMRSPADILAPPAGGGARRVPAWPALAVMALGLFVADVALRRLPVIREVAGRAGAALIAWLRRSPPPPTPDDREYEAADQWRPSPGELEASADMEQAARLYIARLRQEQGTGESHERD